MPREFCFDLVFPNIFEYLIDFFSRNLCYCSTEELVLGTRRENDPNHTHDAVHCSSQGFPQSIQAYGTWFPDMVEKGGLGPGGFGL